MTFPEDAGTDAAGLLKQRYDELALSLDDRTTACDFQLRELELDVALAEIHDGNVVLDVGCGLGYALRQYTAARQISAHGIDYSESMIAGARRRLVETSGEANADAIDFRVASVVDLPFDDALFDVVTSHRCLMALLDWKLQQDALREIHRVLRPGGTLALLEGTFDGLQRLNELRRTFGLGEIDPAGTARLLTLKFHEDQLLAFVDPLYELVRIHRFGTYYFLTRIVQPLLVAPQEPQYDHPLNDVARRVAAVVPDFQGIGHLVGFILRKRT